MAEEKPAEVPSGATAAAGDVSVFRMGLDIRVSREEDGVETI